MKLGININYIANLRNAMGGAEPDLLKSARLCEIAGAQGIAIYYDGKDANVTKSDIMYMKRALRIPIMLIIEMNETARDLALELNPEMVFVVPENMGYQDSRGGFNVEKNVDKLNEFIVPMLYNNIKAGVFIEPKLAQIQAAYKSGAKCVELNARKFSEAFAQNPHDKTLFIELKEAAVFAKTMNLDVTISGGINYKSIELVKTIPTVNFVNMGHSIITKAIFDGLTSAIKQMLEIMNNKD